MSIVHLDADGAYTVTAGDSTSAFTSLREALDAALPAVAAHEKAARLRDVDTGDLNGAWRWLPATDVETVAKEGVRIDAQAIREMADSLNSSPRPVPIDGGPTPKGMLESPVHGTAFSSGTPANGWAHWAVVVEGPGAEDAKLYLFSEIVPEVAREIDAGRMAEGSVHFGYASADGELPRGVELISHALTNDPAVKTLAPANSVRGMRFASRSIHLTGSLRARPLKRLPMAKITIRSQLALRGPALDKLTEVASLLGISIDDEMEAESWSSPTNEAIQAIKSLAKAEKILEGLPPPAAPAAPAAQTNAAKRTEGAPPPAAQATTPPGEGQRAPVAGLADEPAKDKFITDILAALMSAGVISSADDAAAALAACMAMMPKSEGAGDVDEAQQMSASARAGHVAAEQLRSEVEGMKRELAELRPLRDEKRARDHADYIDAEAKRRGITLTTATRAKLLKMDKAGVDAALDLVAQPPTGNVMGGVGDDAQPGDVTSVKAATDACMEEARRSAKKDEPEHYVRARAQDIARKRFPGAFGASAD